MAISAWTGPIVAFGQAQGSNDYNPELGPSLFVQGSGMLDPRLQWTYLPGQNFGSKTLGWMGSRAFRTIYAPPMTLSTTKLTGAGAHVVANTAMTLIAATVAGAAVGVTAVRADTGVSVTGLIEIDPLAMSCTANITLNSNVLTVTAMGSGNGNNINGISPGMVLTDSTLAANIPTGTTIIGYGTGGGGLGTYIMSANAAATATGDTVTGLYTGLPNALPFGPSQTIWMYNPMAMLSRAVSITSTTSQVDSNVFTVNGLDVYGFPMTETITTSGTSATTTNGVKAFKFIKSITPSLTDGTGNYSAGTQDIVGFPIRSDRYQVGLQVDATLMMNNALIASATGYLAADHTATMTATTGDVRGTYALQSASNGTLIFGVDQQPLLCNMGSSVGLFGNTQFTAW